MSLKHIISARQFDRKTLQKIFATTDRIKAKKYKANLLVGKIMATIFYEPSTRTRLSFESAMIRLGGRIISTENAGEFSSVAKGETLEDTVRVISTYSDLIVLRHPKPGASELAAHYSNVPIINAGDGEGEHPTQAILDLYTILSKLKREDFIVAMIGDLRYGRTVHSLSHLLSLYPKVKILFVSPRPLSMPHSLKNALATPKIIFSETEDFRSSLSEADVIYMTRIQRERFRNKNEYQKYFGKYILSTGSLKYLKKGAIIMHPLPRVNEIAADVDRDQRSIYFEQAENGVYTRMALLMMLFDKEKIYQR